MRKITIKILTKLPTRYLTTGIIIIILLLIYGVVGSYFIMDLNIVDSIYYSITTMTTVGYGDYIPYTPIEKIFSTSLSLAGVALLAYVFNIFLTNFQQTMKRYSKEARKMKKINDMERSKKKTAGC